MELPVNLTVYDGIGHIELNRPEAANTINMAMAKSLQDAATTVANDNAVDVVVISAAGSRFCGGGDITAMAAAENRGTFLSTLAATADAGVQVLENMNRPVVAAVHGAVAGAGLGIMLAADIIVSASDTKFVFAYPEVGLTPDCGASVALPRAMGLQRALTFALSGQPLSAQEALQQGLIAEISDDPQVRAYEIAATWTNKASGALGTTRQLLRQSNVRSRVESGQQESTTIGEHVMTSEAATLVEKFLSR